MATENGQKILIRGNRFEQSYFDGSPVALALTLSATQGPNARITDVEIAYNVFAHGAGSYNTLGGIPLYSNIDSHPPPAPLQRVWVHNNLMHGLNSYAYRSYSAQSANISLFDHRLAYEDILIEHNTLHSQHSNSSHFMTVTEPAEGLHWRNNLLWLNGTTLFAGDLCADHVPSCTGLVGDDWLNTYITNSEFVGNSFIVGYTDETETTPRVSKTHVTDYMAGVDAYLISELPGDIEWAAASSGDFRLLPGVSHRSGGSKKATDGLQRGVDFHRLRRELGEIYNVRNKGTTVYATVPDAGAACYVGRGASSNPATWTWTAANTAATWDRSITASGLVAGWSYRVACAGVAQSATKTAE